MRLEDSTRIICSLLLGWAKKYKSYQRKVITFLRFCEIMHQPMEKRFLFAWTINPARKAMATSTFGSASFLDFWYKVGWQIAKNLNKKKTTTKLLNFGSIFIIDFRHCVKMRKIYLSSVMQTVIKAEVAMNPLIYANRISELNYLESLSFS